MNDYDAIDADGDLLDGVPVKSALAYMLAYQFPVQHIAADFLPDAPGEQPTYLSVYRKRDDELGFMELNPVSARLLQLIEENADGRTGRELLQQLATEIGFDTEALLPHGVAAMQELKSQEILLGTAI